MTDDTTASKLITADAYRNALMERYGNIIADYNGRDNVGEKDYILPPSTKILDEWFHPEKPEQQWVNLPSDKRVEIAENLWQEFHTFYDQVKAAKELPEKEAILKATREVMVPIRDVLAVAYAHRDVDARAARIEIMREELSALGNPVKEAQTVTDRLHNLSVGKDTKAARVAQELQLIHVAVSGPQAAMLSDGRSLMTSDDALNQQVAGLRLPKPYLDRINKLGAMEQNRFQRSNIGQFMFEMLQTKMQTGQIPLEGMAEANAQTLLGIMKEIAQDIKDKGINKASFSPETDRLGAPNGLPLTLTNPSADEQQAINL